MFEDLPFIAVTLLVFVGLPRWFARAVDALPHHEDAVIWELLRVPNRVSLALFSVSALVEVGRILMSWTSPLAMLFPIVVGLAAALYRFYSLRTMCRIYELSADDGDHERLQRARGLRKRAYLYAFTTTAVWLAFLAARALAV